MDAPAKINLFLHVTARRADGYHDLDSLVAFADITDRLSFHPGPAWSLDIKGPMAPALRHEGGDNLVLKAARALADLHRELAGKAPRQGRFHLWKELPVAAGVGGGSADAAAALRLLMRDWAFDPPRDRLTDLARALGADIPVCLAGRPARVIGVGDKTMPVPPLPPAGIVLANPGLGLATADVFRALDPAEIGRANAPALPAAFKSLPVLTDWLAAARNDLEAPARRLVPDIAQVLDVLGQAEGVRLARMSGSGATSFALFDDRDAAACAAAKIAAEYPRWWVRAGRLGSGA